MRVVRIHSAGGYRVYARTKWRYFDRNQGAARLELGVPNIAEMLTELRQIKMFALQRPIDSFTNASNGRTIPKEGTLLILMKGRHKFFRAATNFRARAHDIPYRYIV